MPLAAFSTSVICQFFKLNLVGLHVWY